MKHSDPIGRKECEDGVMDFSIRFPGHDSLLILKRVHDGRKEES